LGRPAPGRGSKESLGVHPAFMSATEFGYLVVKEDGELVKLMGLVNQKQQ
jgi:hypothetical protein